MLTNMVHNKISSLADNTNIRINTIIRNKKTRRKEKKKKEKMFVQIKNISYYNVYIHKLKLPIKYFNLNITVTSHAEKVSMFTRQISDTIKIESTLIVLCTYSGYGLDVITKNT